MKRFLLAILFVLVWGECFGADQNIYISSSAAAGGDGSISTPYDEFSDINWTTSGANSIFDWVAANDDVFINLKRGDTFREELNIPADTGSSLHPVSITAYGTGANPIISGAEDFIGVSGDWSDQGGNVWRKNIGAVAPLVVVFNDTLLGVNDATPDSDNEWTYSSPNLDIYSETNPTLYYTRIEAAQRDRCVYIIGESYITIENIIGRIVNNDIFAVNNTSEVTFNNVVGRYATGIAASNAFTAHDTATIYANGLTASHCTIAIAFVQGSTSTAQNIIISDSGQGVQIGHGTHAYSDFNISACSDAAIKADQNTSYTGNTATLTRGIIRNCSKAIELKQTSDISVDASFLSISGCTSTAVTVNNTNSDLTLTHTSIQHDAENNAVFVYDSNELSMHNTAIVLADGLAVFRYALGLGSTTTYTGDYNYFWTGATNKTLIDGVAQGTIASHRTATGQDTNSDFIDSLILANGKIAKTSPCIGTGVYKAGVNMEGQADPWGKYIYKRPNIGADQGAGIPIRKQGASLGVTQGINLQ